jgi:hypothetical protein
MNDANTELARLFQAQLETEEHKLNALIAIRNASIKPANAVAIISHPPTRALLEWALKGSMGQLQEQAIVIWRNVAMHHPLTSEDSCWWQQNLSLVTGILGPGTIAAKQAAAGLLRYLTTDAALQRAGGQAEEMSEIAKLLDPDFPVGCNEEAAFVLANLAQWAENSTTIMDWDAIFRLINLVRDGPAAAKHPGNVRAQGAAHSSCFVASGVITRRCLRGSRSGSWTTGSKRRCVSRNSDERWYRSSAWVAARGRLYAQRSGAACPAKYGRIK